MSRGVTGASLRHSYGPSALQFGDLYLGHSPERRHTVIVIVHGGFWRPHRTVATCAPIAEDLARRGWTTWNIEYRRVGQGDWRATLDDCASAFDQIPVLAEEFSLKVRRVLALGYSAGAHLAVWSAGRHAVARRRGSHAPPVHVDAVVSLAGVLDLKRAARARIGEDAAAQFMGALPEDDPYRYREADPIARLPIGVEVHCVHDRSDDRVPFEQSVRYVEAAQRAADAASLVEVSGAHPDLIDVESRAWRTVVDALEHLDTPRGESHGVAPSRRS